MNELMKYVNKQKSVHSECFIQARSVSCRKGSEICRDVQQFTGKFGILPMPASGGAKTAYFRPLSAGYIIMWHLPVPHPKTRIILFPE